MLRKPIILKTIACILLLDIVQLILLPTFIIAQNGNSKNIFNSVIDGQAVDLFTGNFNYNIPLLEVPGVDGSYPINLNYQSGILLNQESSMVGLGWNISAGGAINRSISQYPDDLNGEEVFTDVASGVGNRWGWGEVEMAWKDDIQGGYYGSRGGSGNNFETEKYSFLNKVTKVERAYGTLYQSNMPTVSSSASGTSYTFQMYTDPSLNPPAYVTYVQGLASGLNIAAPISADKLALSSDIYQYQTNAKIYNNLNPVYMAYDKYTLSGSLMGQIQPYRFDNPTISFPLAFNQNNFGRISTYKYNITVPQTQKVQFRFAGEASNNYEYHKTASSNYVITAAPYQFGVWDGPWCDNGDRPLYSLQYANQPVNMTQFDPANSGFNSSTSELKQSNYIEWFSNSEFTDGTAKTKGLINNEVSFDRSDVYYPQNGIGGFKITDASGITYHYTIPVYNNTRTANYFELGNAANRSILNTKYASQWLLTAITGPSFIDKNNNGIIDSGDLGYFVKFEYGRFATDYKWRFPYSGTTFISSSINSRIMEEGTREEYFLNSVSTNTHTALFVKDFKRDGKSFYNINSDIRQSLKLNEIVLMKNEHVDYMKNSLGLSYTNNCLLKTDVSGSTFENYILANQIKKIVLNTDYSLCKNTPNSFDFNQITQSISNSNGGKLSLLGVSFLYKDGIKYEPDYKFEYNSNPDFSYNAWDAWGYYKNIVGESLTSHDANNDGIAWSLSRIICPTGGEMSIQYQRDDYINVNGYPISSIKMGDGLRVSSITVRGSVSNEEYKYRYVYTIDGNISGTSSGVCSAEPSFSRQTGYSHSFYSNPNSPNPMVGYSKVAVFQEINGVQSVNSFKEEHSYITPHNSMVKVNTLVNTGRVAFFPEIEIQTDCFSYLGDVAKTRFGEAYYNVAYEDINTTNQIGNLLKVEKYTGKGHLVYKADYEYFGINPPNRMGIITQACNLVDRTLDFYDVATDTYSQLYEHNNRKTTRLINTISKYIPSVLKSVKVTQNGVTTITSNTDFDFYTGKVTETEYINSTGEKYRAKTIPAYKKYANMGSKVDDIDNKNMLLQETANYTYAVDVSNNNDLINANVQTWYNTWNYREYISSAYTNDPQTDVWRKYKTYVWKTDAYNDGTAGSFTDFNWTSTPNAGWQKTNEVTLYDHYSQAIESKDINGNYSAVKKGGLNGNFVIASSGASNYNSFVHSSFEDLLSNNYFGGEVAMQSGIHFASNGTINAHTGKYLAKTQSSYQGPIFKVSSNLQTGKTYQASVWVHKDSPSNTALYVILDGTAGSAIHVTKTMAKTDANAVQVGDWILLKKDIEVPSNYVHSGGSTNDLKTYVYTGTGGYAYTDDMRLQPVNSPVTGYVYDEKKGVVTAMLDNENFATFFTYDAANRLIKTEKETAIGIKKVSESWYHYGRP